MFNVWLLEETLQLSRKPKQTKKLTSARQNEHMQASNLNQIKLNSKENNGLGDNWDILLLEINVGATGNILLPFPVPSLPHCFLWSFTPWFIMVKSTNWVDG